MQTPTATSTGLFDALTVDELRALQAAIITAPWADGRPGFSSNRLASMLIDEAGSDSPAYLTYAAISAEVCQLHHEISQLFIARCQA
jgi:hypothetical protein